MGNTVPPEVWAQIEAERALRDREEQVARLDADLSELSTLDPVVRGSDVAKRLTDIRNKGVSHYEVARDGASWRLWAEGGAAVTWGEINDFIDACTRCIELLYGVVCHTSFNFEDAKRIYQGNVDDFIGALTAGLTANKEQLARERAEELARRRAEHGL